MYRRFLSLLILLVINLMTLTSALADSTSELLEQAIYTEETMGDLEAAISIYDQIISDAVAGRANVAKALFRQGMCYLKLGQEKQSVRAFKKLIKTYPDQSKLIAEAQQILNESKISGLKLDPVPWQNDEVAHYKLISPAGVDLGALAMSTQGLSVDGKPLWRIENYMVIPLSNVENFSRIDVDQTSFKPASGTVKNSLLGDYLVDYQQHHIELKVNSKDKESTKKVAVSGPVYDDTQIFGLLRRLPLTVGYQTQIPIFTPHTSTLNESRIEVKGKEQITVPIGSFDCYKVQMDQFVSGSLILKQTVWISTDHNRQVIKLENDNMTMELAEIRIDKANIPVTHQDQQTGISVTTPPGWHILKSGTPDPSWNLFLQLQGPELNVSAMFISKTLGNKVPPGLTVNRIVQGDIQAIKGYFKDYTLRENNPADLKIFGLPAQSFVADYEFQHQKMVEHRTYILGKKGVHWFVFRLEPDVFDASIDTIESIIKSFTIK